MNPLSLNRKILIWLSVCPTEGNENDRQKIKCNAFTCIIILESILAVIASVIYFLKYKSIHLESALYAFSVIVAVLGTLYIVSIALFTRRKITLIFSNLSQLYDSSKNLRFFISDPSSSKKIILLQIKIPNHLIC